MVRNLIGGNQAKRQGRKFATNLKSPNELQLSTNEFEVYGCVVKMYGGTCSIKTFNDKTLLCTIRKKFKGQSKRNNLIEIGSIVLVGLFPWQNVDNKIQKCDLLTIYDTNEYNKLLLIPSTKINLLEKYMTQNIQEINDDIIFTLQENNTDTKRVIDSNLNSKVTTSVTNDIETDDTSPINIDDI
jgi:hypothetical protein